MLQQNINLIMGVIVLLSNILFVALVASIFLKKEFKNYIFDFTNKYILQILFVFSTSALVGSLVYSNIAGFPPCELCWIQRIFMYPQALFTFIAMLKKDKGIVSYLFPMTILGMLTALYQSFSNWGFGGSLLPCTAEGGACSKVYVLMFGYITIPFMALTSFAFLFLASYIYFRSIKERI